MKISKVTQYAINWLYHCDNTVDEIAEELKISNKQVTQHIEKNFSEVKNNQLATKSEPVKKSNSKELMIRHTRDKKTNSVAIMTKEASQVNDSLRTSLSQSVKNQDCIFKQPK